MRTHHRRNRLIVAAVTLLLLGNGAVSAEADPATPHLEFGQAQVRRGFQEMLYGSSLTPDTTYRLSAPYGYFSIAGTQVVSVVSDDSGAFQVAYNLTSDVPVDVTSVAVNATAPDDTTVTATVAVLGPWLGRGGGPVCGGKPAPASGVGFPDGTYTLTSPQASFAPASVTATNGRFGVNGTYAANLPATITVTATAQDAGHVSYSFTWHRDDPLLRDHLDADTPWSTHYQATCFTPGETVAFTTTDRHTETPRPVKADQTGSIAFAVRSIASPGPTRPGGVIARGAQSGQTATTGHRYTYGSSLAAGGTVPGTTAMLLSPHYGYAFSQNYCALKIFRYDSDGGSGGTWFAPEREGRTNTCRLTLRTDGNLVLTSATHAVLWSSHTNGTGAHNRLAMRDDGNLVLYNSANKAVWSSETGIIRTPRELGEGQTLTRGQSLVNGHARLRLGRHGNLVIQRYGRTVWRSNTAHRGITHLLLGYSGNLMLLTARGHIVWSSHTPDGGSRNYLCVFSNGAVQIRNQYGDVLWRSRTGR